MTHTAIDLFAGAGGATQGLRDAGFDVRVAVELEQDAADTWRANHPGLLLQKDVREVTAPELLRAAKLVKGELTLLKACPPCQGFSSLRGSRTVDERRNDLVLDTLRLVRGLQPRAILLENVPGLARDSRFAKLQAGLATAGYELAHYLVEASELGVPQRRRRLVLVALRQQAALPVTMDHLVPAQHRRPATTAGAALTSLRTQLPAGDETHRWRQSGAQVQRRIAAVPVGGNRFDLPADLRLACHERLTTARGDTLRSATGSYGRVRLDEPAPTMTTRCTTPACGSFIHPTEPRGLSLREAAALQTFPATYQWRGGYDDIERQIGNAVPVWMAQALGEAVLRLLDLTSPATAN